MAMQSEMIRRRRKTSSVLATTVMMMSVASTIIAVPSPAMAYPVGVSAVAAAADEQFSALVASRHNPHRHHHHHRRHHGITDDVGGAKSEAVFDEQRVLAAVALAGDFCASQLAECAERCGGTRLVLRTACGSDDNESAFRCMCASVHDDRAVQDAYESHIMELALPTDTTSNGGSWDVANLFLHGDHMPNMHVLSAAAAAAAAQEQQQLLTLEHEVRDIGGSYGAWLSAVVIDVVTVTVEEPMLVLKQGQDRETMLLCAIHASLAAAFVVLSVLCIAHWLCWEEENETELDEEEERDDASSVSAESQAHASRAAGTVTVVVADTQRTPLLYAYEEVESMYP